MKSRRTLFALVLVPAVVALFTGCSTPTQPAAMAPTIAPGLVHASAGTVSLNVTGGKETSAAGASQISNVDFTTALRTAIDQSDVFAQVLGAGAADYHLEVMLVRMQQPMMGFSMTVTLEINWTLSRRSDQSVVWQKALVTTFTAKAGEAFAGVKRLRLATEGAARDNIDRALRQIAEVNIP